MSEDLRELIPTDKLDTTNAKALVALGYPAVAEALPSMLEWVQDLNWPVARVFRPFLAGIGAPLAPHIRAIVNTTDETWKWSVLQGIVGQSRELAESLRSELRRLEKSPTPREAHEGLQTLAQEIAAGLRA
jgi:Domain of unknown function (DUF5071)